MLKVVEWSYCGMGFGGADDGLKEGKVKARDIRLLYRKILRQDRHLIVFHQSILFFFLFLLLLFFGFFFFFFFFFFWEIETTRHINQRRGKKAAF